MVSRLDLQSRVATSLPKPHEPKADEVASTAHGNVPTETPTGAAAPGAPAAATEPKTGWTKEAGAVPPPLTQDAMISAFAEGLVGGALEKAAFEGDLSALVTHFSGMPDQLKEAFSTPRGRAAFLTLISGYATRFMSLSTSQTPLAQQQLADRLGSLLLFMGKPVPNASRQGPVPKQQPSAEVRARMIDQVSSSLAHPAVEGMQDERGRSPAEAAHAMFSAANPRELDQKTSERFSLKAELEPQLPPSLDPAGGKDPTVAPARARGGLTYTDDEEGSPLKRPPRKGLLGGNLFWNVLHTVDSDDPNEVSKRDRWNRVLVSAALILVLGASIVVALVYLS